MSFPLQQPVSTGVIAGVLALGWLAGSAIAAALWSPFVRIDRVRTTLERLPYNWKLVSVAAFVAIQLATALAIGLTIAAGMSPIRGVLTRSAVILVPIWLATIVAIHRSAGEPTWTDRAKTGLVATSGTLWFAILTAVVFVCLFVLLSIFAVSLQ